MYISLDLWARCVIAMLKIMSDFDFKAYIPIGTVKVKNSSWGQIWCTFASTMSSYKQSQHDTQPVATAFKSTPKR